MGQADPILTKLNAGPAVKKLVETALALSSSQDPQQRNHAYSFMESAIKELEGENRGADAGLGPVVDDGINAPKLSEEEEDDDKLNEEEGKHDAVSKVFEEQKDDKDDHKLHEEELSNNNQGGRTTGSEQSTENVAPYAGEGVDTTTGEKPMQDMDDTVNQWSETNGMIVPGLPPSPEMMTGGGMPPPMNGGMPPPNGGMPPMPGGNGGGLAPDIAQEMGQQMPPMPPLNDNQMMRQMQYTFRNEIRSYDNRVVAPMRLHIKTLNETDRKQRETIKEQRNAIKQLALELRETKTAGGNLKLDLDVMRQNSTASFRETTQHIQGYTSPEEIQSVTGVQPLPNYQRHKVAIARSEIEQMNKMLNSNKNPMYN